MPRLIVTGGAQRNIGVRRVAEWRTYGEARLAVVDTETGVIETKLVWKTPADACPDEECSIVFKAASWDGDRLLLCTQTEVMWVDPTSYEVLHRVSHPWFNDVHHVLRVGGRVRVMSTGLDAVVTLGADDTSVERIDSTLPTPVWERHDPDVDYRKVLSTKPHPSHSNYVVEGPGGTVWATRFKQGDVASLDDLERRVSLGSPMVHDGNPAENGLWFTRVDGHVVRLDDQLTGDRQEWSLQAFESAEAPLGWCRSVHRDQGTTYVGFSRIRQTKLVQNLKWLRGRVGGTVPVSRPTRVAAYDLAAGRLLDEWDLEETGINAVFSILPSRSDR
jgi:hypothetical protein